MNARIEETYFTDGTLEHRCYYNNNNVLHREDGPAQESFYKNGALEVRVWRKHGKIHSEDGPAEEWFSRAGICMSRRWCINGQIHREDGPAYEDFNEAGICLGAEFWLDDMYILPGDYHRQVLLRKLQRKTGSEMGVSL